MKPVAVGAHIYAGGFTLGVSKYFDVLAHMESDGYGEKVINLNFPKIDFFKPASQWIDTPTYKDRRIEFVFGNPPCAPFSIMPSMKGKDWKTDKRLEHTLDVFNLLQKIKPKVLAIESVSQAWTQGQSFVLGLANQAEELGYSTTELLHDSQYLGLPQRRKRTFHIFHNIDLKFDVPDYDHTISAGEALKRVKKVEPQNVDIQEKFQRYYEAANPGEPLCKAFDRVHLHDVIQHDTQGRVKGRPRFIMSKLNLAAPAPTLIGGLNLMHPDEPRYLYLEELVEIMGFPQTYQWPDRSYEDVSHYLSRGVNPLAAEWLGKGVSESIGRDDKITKPTFKLLDWRNQEGYDKDKQVTLL